MQTHQSTRSTELFENSNFFFLSFIFVSRTLAFGMVTCIDICMFMMHLMHGILSQLEPSEHESGLYWLLVILYLICISIF